MILKPAAQAFLAGLRAGLKSCRHIGNAGIVSIAANTMTRFQTTNPTSKKTSIVCCRLKFIH